MGRETERKASYPGRDGESLTGRVPTQVTPRRLRFPKVCPSGRSHGKAGQQQLFPAIWASRAVVTPPHPQRVLASWAQVGSCTGHSLGAHTRATETWSPATWERQPGQGRTRLATLWLPFHHMGLLRDLLCAGRDLLCAGPSSEDDSHRGDARELLAPGSSQKALGVKGQNPHKWPLITTLPTPSLTQRFTG